MSALARLAFYENLLIWQDTSDRINEVSVKRVRLYSIFWLLVKDGLEHLLHLRLKTDIPHNGNYGVNNVRIRDDELGQHFYDYLIACD